VAAIDILEIHFGFGILIRLASHAGSKHVRASLDAVFTFLHIYGECTLFRGIMENVLFIRDRGSRLFK
jgi:hypothetical protein